AVPPADGAATATGAAAFTSNVSSNCFTKSESSSRVISLNASRRSSVLIFAMWCVPRSFKFLARDPRVIRAWSCAVRSAFVAAARRGLRVGGARLGNAGLGSAGLSRVGFGSAGLGSAGLGSAAFGFGALGAQRLGDLGHLHRQRVERRGRAGQR